MRVLTRQGRLFIAAVVIVVAFLVLCYFIFTPESPYGVFGWPPPER